MAKLNKPKPTGITLKAKVTQAEINITPLELFDSCWVGIGFVGSKTVQKTRRFLRVRTITGPRFFYWTKPFKGKEVPCVFMFRKIVKVTREKAERHFKK